MNRRNELNNVSKQKISSPRIFTNDVDKVVTRNGLNADLINSFFNGVSDYVIDKSKYGALEMIKWQDLVNILWSFAYSGQGLTLKSEGLIIALSQEVTRRLTITDISHEMPTPEPRDLSQLGWALGVLQCNNFRIATSLIYFIDAFSKYLQYQSQRRGQSLFHNWKGADMVQLAVCLAHGRLDKNELLIPMYDEVLLSLNSTTEGYHKEFSNGELTALLWVQARLYLIDGVFQAFSDMATRTLVQRVYPQSAFPREAVVNNLECQEQANLAWSLVVLEQYSNEAVTLLKAIFESSSLLYSQGGDFHVEHAHQLWQAYYILQRDCPSAVESVPSAFIDFLRLRWRKEKLRLKTSSERHIALSKTLDLMGVAHINEHDEDIDVAIILKNDSLWTQNSIILDDTVPGGSFHRVAVEFDGPNHFVRPHDGVKLAPKECPRPLGHTILKYRLLQIHGWFVIRVPYYEYDKIPFWASMVRMTLSLPSFILIILLMILRFNRKGNVISSAY